MGAPASEVRRWVQTGFEVGAKRALRGLNRGSTGAPKGAMGHQGGVAGHPHLTLGASRPVAQHIKDISMTASNQKKGAQPATRAFESGPEYLTSRGVRPVSDHFATLIDYLAARDRVGEDIAQRTRDDYARRVEKLRARLVKAGLQLTPHEVVREYKKQISTQQLTRATARHIRAAYYFWIAEEAQGRRDRGESFTEHAAAFSEIAQQPIHSLPTKTERASGTRAKEFPKEALSLVEAYVVQHPHAALAQHLLIFLRANLMLGLRPDEWFGATGPCVRFALSGDGGYQRTKTGDIRCVPAMVVENAKTTGARSNGEFRELLLFGVTDDQFKAIADCAQMTWAYRQRFPQDTKKDIVVRSFLTNLNECLKRVLKAQGYSGPSLTLYCTRHQAVANAKSGGLTDREVAAFFGHASARTARLHYGKKAKAWGRTTFRPSPESIAGVRGINTLPAIDTLLSPKEPWIAQLGDRVIDRPE